MASLRTGTATGGTLNGVVNGTGSLLAGMRLASTDWPATTLDSGNDNDAPANRPTLMRSLRFREGYVCCFMVSTLRPLPHRQHR